jgi:hypothetical protein
VSSIARPDPVVPVPAAGWAETRGRRVIVGVPGLGFRDGLRADNPVVQGGRTWVPVLTEQDFYRAETEQVEMFAPLVPVERVWIEQIGTDGRPLPSQPALGHPAIRQPAAVRPGLPILGLRLVQAVPDGFIRDLRATTDVYDGGSAGACVRVCGEAEWYRWALQGAVPSTMEVPADLLWCE